MLSTPLPADYPVPAALPAFALQVLDGAVMSPSAATLGLLYTVLKGIGSDLLQVLPPRKSAHLQDQLIKLLRNFDDHKVNLLCLAIFALLCSSQPVWSVCEEHSSLQDSQALKASTEARSEDVCCAARLFFTLKAQKTLELVVLRSIMLCSSSITPSDAISSLMLAREILDTVDAIERSNWVEKNKLKVRKLYEKVRKPEIDRTVRLVAFEVIASLSEVKSLPDDLIATVEGLLQQTPSSYDAKRIWKAYAARFSEAFMKSQISKALQTIAETDRSSTDFLVKVNDMRIFVGTLVELVKTDSTVRQTLLVTISSNGIQDSIWRLLSCAPIQAKNITKHRTQEACMAHIIQVRWLLSRDVCVLLLNSAFFTASKPLAIDPYLATLLLENASCASGMIARCDTFPLARARFEPAVLVSSMKAHDSSDWSFSQDWRAALKENLDMDAACRHEFVVRKVNEFCRDLESRCNNAERPLKEEQKRSKDLAHELETCQANCANLKVEAQENMLVLESLQTGQNQLVDQKNTAEQRARGLSEELDLLRLKLKVVTQEAQDASIVAKEVLRRQELSHLAAMTAKDELLDSEARKIASVESKVAQVEVELRSAECESEAVSVKLDESHETIKDRDAKIAELENFATSYKVESNHQIDTLKKDAAEAETLKSKVTEMRSEVEALVSKEKQSNDNFRLVILDLEKKYEFEIVTRDAEILRQGLEHERADTALRNELVTTMNKTARLAEMHDARIGELLGQLEILRTERAMRAKEFAEAQDLSGKLMALMGRKPGRPAATSAPTDAVHMKTNHVIETTSEEDVQVASQRSLGSRALSRNNGSTPKRARVQRKSKTLTVPPIRLSTGSKTLRYMKSARRPLEDLDVGMHNDAVVVHDQIAREEYKCETSSEFFEETINEKQNMLSKDMCDFSITDSHVFSSTGFHQVDDQTTEDAPGLIDRAITDL
ncbi:hypothetical protein MMC17_007371 [Xylographa soralifera]|nr:hypothetical protein [Xylographa soralifera]